MTVKNMAYWKAKNTPLKQKKKEEKTESVAGQYLEKKKGADNVYYDVDYPEKEYKAKEGVVSFVGENNEYVEDHDYIIKGDSIVGVKGSKEYPFAEDE